MIWLLLLFIDKITHLQMGESIVKDSFIRSEKNSKNGPKNVKKMYWTCFLREVLYL